MGSPNAGSIPLLPTTWITIFREGTVWGIASCGLCLGDGVGGSNWLRVSGSWVLNSMLTLPNSGLMPSCQPFPEELSTALGSIARDCVLPLIAAELERTSPDDCNE